MGVMSDDKPKRYTMSDAALAQRRAAAQLSTGPKTEDGKAASSRNAWKHGLYSQITRAGVWEQIGLGMRAKPCLTTCPRHPCSLVVDGYTKPGGDCLDKAVYLESFDAIMTTLQTGDVQNIHGMMAAQIASAMELLQEVREAISVDGVMITKPYIDKEGQVVLHPETGKPIGQPVVNPLLVHFYKIMGELGITLPEAMATPRAMAVGRKEEESADAVAELFGKLARVAGGRAPKTIDHYREDEDG